MKLLSQAVTAALCSLGMASAAQAATYIVTAHGNGFDQRLAQRIEADAPEIAGIPVAPRTMAGRAPSPGTFADARVQTPEGRRAHLRNVGRAAGFRAAPGG